MVGFVQSMPKITGKQHSMAAHEVQCFWAEQETHYDMEKTVSVKTESDTVKVAVITTENKIVTDDLAAPTDNNDLELDDDVSLAEVSSENSLPNLSLAQLSSENEMKIK